MKTSSSEGVIPVASNNDEEDPAMPKKDLRADSPQVAHDMPLPAEAPSATASNRLPLPRSPSPVADHRISQWRNEKRAFKGNITRKSKGPGAIEAARAAQKSALMVGGQPQFVMFCDGSSGFKSGPNATKDGGYAVVFRDPYDANKAATASASEAVTATFPGPREEDGITVGDFTIRYWLSHRTFGNGHTEIAALAQALEEVTKRIDQHHPDTSIIKIFTDFDGSLSRILKGILTFETTTAADSLKRKRALTRKELADTSFFAEHTNPFVQAMVWQSHYLSDRGCTIEINWMPRNTTLGHRLADHMAGQWRWEDPGVAFNQKYLPHDQRDGILDKLHGEVGAIERERAYDTLDSRRQKRKIKRATGAKRRSTEDRIALLDSPSDYIPLDSESEGTLAPEPRPQKKKQNIKGAIRDQKRSTEDYILLDSDSDEETQRPNKRRRVRRPRVKKTVAEDHVAPDGPNDHIPLDSESEKEAEPQPGPPQPPKKEQKPKVAITAKQEDTSDYIPPGSGSEQKTKPKPQPPKEKLEIKGTTTGKQRSTSDFILLDSDSEEQPDVKRPQTPKKRKKIRGAIPAKKKVPMQQVEANELPNVGDHEAGASGFLLGGEDPAFTFDPGNLPAYPAPNQEHALHDPDSGHGTPGCLLCQDDEYPWRSGYTGLPSQWALRRY